jgi:protein-S-isoprenylcysteine O-methyltransferase Ste14
MSILELKIPPVIVTLLFAVLMWLVARLTPSTPIDSGFRIIAVLLLGAAATVIGVAGVVAFRKANTTVNPLIPDACTSLVNSGIFRLTRNPMYLALLLTLTAWGFILSNFYSLALCVVYVVYLNRFQIVPEERALEAVFGDEFIAYREKVRRWI